MRIGENKVKLTKKDKDILKEIGYLDEDMEQIERATTKTSFELEDKKIRIREVLKLLSRREFLSGIGRSAFHRSCVRNKIYFNSGELFK
jgi:hypothetical protein